MGSVASGIDAAVYLAGGFAAAAASAGVGQSHRPQDTRAGAVVVCAWRDAVALDLHRERYCWRTGADFQSACGGRNRAPYDRPWRGAADVNVVVPTPMANMVHGLLRT